MTYYGGKEMAAAFRTVRDNTLKAAQEIPESQYDIRATPDTMTIGQLLTHIAFGPSFPFHVHGDRLTDLGNFNFPEFVQKMRTEEAKPRTKTEIIALLTSEGDKFATFLEGLPDTVLAERVTQPPGDPAGTKSRFEMLLGAKEHEMHHRGQLMLLERMAGIVPHLTRERRARMAQAQATHLTAAAR